MNRFTLFWRRPHGKTRRPPGVHLHLEQMEARNLLSSPTNVLVNNPAEDTIPMQDTQSETAIVLGAGSKVVVAYEDDGIASVATPALTGYSTSGNGGATFADKGSL